MKWILMLRHAIPRLPLIAAALGTALILSRQASHGVGLEWDSITYISTARNLLAGEGFISNIGKFTEYTRWPPLYPLLLAGGDLLGADPLAAAGPINVAAFALTVFFFGRWLQQHLQSRFLVLWACLVAILAIPLTRVASWAYSEGPFILFATLALSRADTFLGGGRRSSLIWAAVFTALACLTRYIGLALVLTVLPLLLVRPGVALSERIKHGAAYISIAVAPVGLWMLFNILRVGRPTGHRELSPQPLSAILDAILADLSRWVFFLPLSGGVRVVASALVGMVLLVLAIAIGYVIIGARAKNGAWLEWRPFCLCGGFALAFLAAVAATAALTYVAPLGGRMTAPAYIPLLFAGAFALDRFALLQRVPKSRGLLTAVLALWLVLHLPLTAREIWLANGEHGMGFAGPKWTGSEILQQMRESDIGGRVISSSPATYLYADVREYVFLSRTLNGARQKIANAADGDYVVWFHADAADYGYGVDELGQLPELERVAALSDGVIFRIDKDSSDDTSDDG